MPVTDPKVLSIQLNGEPAEVPTGLTVASLLAHLAVDSSRVAVEYNRRIVRKNEWGNTPVETGAQVEIVEFVGGG